MASRISLRRTASIWAKRSGSFFSSFRPAAGEECFSADVGACSSPPCPESAGSAAGAGGGTAAGSFSGFSGRTT